MNSRINVTKSFMPPLESYEEYVHKLFENCWLTNQGPLLKELEFKISGLLNLKHFHYVTNGTIALQLALRALDITDGEIITTPFSYVATVSSILWERCTPVFVDIESNNYMIDVNKIEEKITAKTKAIMPVNIFGYACDIHGVQKIADKYGLKVIYDSAHCFGSYLNGKSLLDFGDISTCSFHATKLFHTVEGGACVVKNKEISDRLELIKKFGHVGDEHYCLGINAKQSEFHAAMGLSILPFVDGIIKKRKLASQNYDEALKGLVQRPKKQEGLKYNYAYYPVVLETEQAMISVLQHLNANNIFPRRYFYPSLNRLPYLEDYQSCPISEDISSKILCLPLYSDISEQDQERVITGIKEVLR